MRARVRAKEHDREQDRHSSQDIVHAKREFLHSRERDA